MYLKKLLSIAKSILLQGKTKAMYRELTIGECSYLDDVFVCRDSGEYTVVGLLRLKRISRSLNELIPEEILQGIRGLTRFLANTPCEIHFYTKFRGSSIDRYIKDIDRKLQIKLVELAYDPTNVRVKNEIRRLEELKKRALQGSQPVETSTNLVCMCRVKDLDLGVNYMRSIQNMLKILGLEFEFYRDDNLLKSINFRR